MICNKCGENNLDNSKFCRSCGTNLGQLNIQNAEKNKVTKINFDFKEILGNKKIIIGAASIVLAVVVLIIAISVIGSLTKTELYVTTENYISYAYSPETEKTSVFINDTLLSSSIKGKATKVSSNTDGTIAAFISEEDVLYVVQQDTVQKIADDIISAVLSCDGSVMAYINQDQVLFTIQLDSKKIERITGDYNFEFSMPMISPDGNALVYAVDGDEWCSYIRVNSKATKMEGFWGVWTSDDGKVIGGLDEDEALCLYDLKNDSIIKLSNDVDDIIVNSNYTEILFSYDSKYYISVNGGERIKIGNYTDLYPILPDNTSYMGSSFVSAVNSFIGTLMVYCEDGTYGIGYIDESYEMHEVIKNIDSYNDYIYITEDSNVVYYIRNECLYMATRELNFEPEKLISDVEYYQVSPDGKKIYYVNSDYELLCRYKNEDKMIAEDVNAGSLTITSKGTVFFLTDYSDNSGTLYRCSDGKNKIRVADDVFTVYVYPEYVKYYTELEYDNDYITDIFVSTNEKDFKKIADDVTFYY